MNTGDENVIAALDDARAEVRRLQTQLEAERTLTAIGQRCSPETHDAAVRIVEIIEHVTSFTSTLEVPSQRMRVSIELNLAIEDSQLLLELARGHYRPQGAKPNPPPLRRPRHP